MSSAVTKSFCLFETLHVMQFPFWQPPLLITSLKVLIRNNDDIFGDRASLSLYAWSSLRPRVPYQIPLPVRSLILSSCFWVELFQNPHYNPPSPHLYFRLTEQPLVSRSVLHQTNCIYKRPMCAVWFLPRLLDLNAEESNEWGMFHTRYDFVHLVQLVQERTSAWEEWQRVEQTRLHQTRYE